MVDPLKDIAQAGIDAKAQAKATVTEERATAREWMEAHPFRWGAICLGAGLVAAGLLMWWV